MKSLGVDIGSSSIKVVEVQSTSKGFQINQYFELPLKTQSSTDQELEVLEFLRSLSVRYDLNKTKFCWSLPQDQVVVRLKEFPFADRLKINKSLAFELEEDIPFSSENAIFDHKMLRTYGTQALVLACASPKHHVQASVQKSKDAMMEAHVLSSQAFALANLIERWDEPPLSLPARASGWEEATPAAKNLNLILQMGHSKSLVLAMEGTTLLGVRTISWGGKNIAEAISKKYEISFSEALLEMQNKAFILLNKQGRSFDQILFSETIAKSVRDLTRDLQLVFLDLKTELKADIHEMLITGGVSQIQGLGPFLTQMLEVPVNNLPVLEQYPEVYFERSSDLSAKLGLALGLAIEGLKKPRNPALNFLKEEFRRDNRQLQFFWQNWGPLVQMAGWTFIVFLVYSLAREHFAVTLNDASVETLKQQAQSVAQLSKKQSNDSGVKKYIRENKKIASDLKKLSQVSSMNSALDVLKRISDSSPAKGMVHIDIRKIFIENDTLTIEGHLKNAREKSLLQESLVRLSTDGKIATLTPSSPPSTVHPIGFAYSLRVDRGLQERGL